MFLELTVFRFVVDMSFVKGITFLVILWALGFFAFHVAGGLIHLLLVIGIIVLIWNFVAGRRAV